MVREKKKKSKYLQLLQPGWSKNSKVNFIFALPVPRIQTEGGFNPCENSSIIPSDLIIFSEQEKTTILRHH